MKVTAMVVDDEPIARAGLRAMLAAFDWIAVIGEAATGTQAVERIDTLTPELLFLDIEMPGLNGLDVLRRIETRPFVIFTTAYSEHAVSAFELGAVDYLLKPFGPTRLAAAMERVRSAIGEPAAIDVVERLSGAMGTGVINRLFVRVGGALIPLPVEQVTHLEADGDYVRAYTPDSAHVLHIALARLEARLDPAKFVRVHRAHLINLDHVKQFKPDVRGNLEAILADGSRVPVSRAKAQEIRSLGR